ncbi:MAG: hemerythrin domain-containing protein [Thaumarchaeota archaeon]|nr:hemerythrin domain-containing protein [Nitrososphaerota archaeon]
MSRQMDPEDLIQVLLKEHTQIRAELREFQEAVRHGENKKAASLSLKLRKILTQHIAYEDAELLGFLTRAYGTDGTSDAIEIFHQHKPILELFEEMVAASSASPSDAVAKAARLTELIRQHTMAEEGRIYPCACSAQETGLLKKQV